MTEVKIARNARHEWTCERPPPSLRAATQVHGGELVLFDRSSGAIQKRFSTWDTIDVCATTTYDKLTKNADWIHLNAFDASLATTSLRAVVVSSFYLGWVYAIDFDTGDVRWLLGKCHDDFPTTCDAFRDALPLYELDDAAAPSSRVDQRYDAGQHNVRVVLPPTKPTNATWADVRILAFANGGRPDRGLDVPSRLVVWRMSGPPGYRKAYDANATQLRPPPGRAVATWAYEDGSYSPFLGGAQPILDDKGALRAVLGDFGAKTDPPANFDTKANWAKTNCNSATIAQVDLSGQVTFQLTFGGRDTNGSCGPVNDRSWNSYRALRIPKPTAFA